jgi:hypothetical protein
MTIEINLKGKNLEAHLHGKSSQISILERLSWKLYNESFMDIHYSHYTLNYTGYVININNKIYEP